MKGINSNPHEIGANNSRQVLNSVRGVLRSRERPERRESKTLLDSMSQTLHIRLSEADSAALAALGEQCFAMASFERSDARTGLWMLHLVPCTHNQANAALRLAQGLSKERRIKATNHKSGAV